MILSLAPVMFMLFELLGLLTFKLDAFTAPPNQPLPLTPMPPCSTNAPDEVPVDCVAVLILKILFNTVGGPGYALYCVEPSPIFNGPGMIKVLSELILATQLPGLLIKKDPVDPSLGEF